jgi:hypothetical protein
MREISPVGDELSAETELSRMGGLLRFGRLRAKVLPFAEAR